MNEGSLRMQMSEIPRDAYPATRRAKGQKTQLLSPLLFLAKCFVSRLCHSASYPVLLLTHEHFFKLISELQSCPMESASNGAYRQVEDLGDRFIAATIDFPQYENIPMLVAEDRQGLADLSTTFLPFEVVQRAVVRIDRLLATVLSCLVDREDRPTSSSLGRSHIEGDPIKPSVKGASSPKRLQLDEGLHERVLDHVEGIVRRPDDMNQRIEQPVLIFLDQLPKSGRIAGQRLFDQSGVVVHRFGRLDARGQ